MNETTCGDMRRVGMLVNFAYAIVSSKRLTMDKVLLFRVIPGAPVAI